MSKAAARFTRDVFIYVAIIRVKLGGVALTVPADSGMCLWIQLIYSVCIHAPRCRYTHRLRTSLQEGRQEGGQ